ncbi:hypothetical protein C1646_677713 [Rhizophagus diaphanus]|nr:hypothetical protein C1646_677713 [Rhizophagus diaphanus] [Rhizophagus sp. MUCL 43196]
MSAVALENTSGVKMIIDKKEWQLPKPVSNRSGYDMEYYRVYLGNYFGNMNIKKFLDNEKLYDSLSIMRKEESPMQFIELIEAKDMMQGHWDQECSDPLNDLGRVRVKQLAFDKFKKNDLIGVYCNKLRPPLNKYQNSVRDEPHSSIPNILFISSRYAKQSKGTALRLRDGTVIMIV